MSILIKRFEIPEEGAIRVVIQKHCGIAVAYTGEDPYQRAHEVVELPEKHGRLIDADALIRDHFSPEHRIALSEANKTWMRKIINDAPTIVEAEGER